MPPPSSSSSHGFVARRSMLSLAVLMVILFLVAICSLIYIARSENAHFLEHSISDAEKALNASQDLTSRVLRDYASWSDTYPYTGGTHTTFNRMAMSLYRNDSIDGAFIVDQHGETRYALIKGKPGKQSVNNYVAGDLQPLFDMARSTADTDRVSLGYYAVAGRPAVVYAVALKPAQVLPIGVDHPLSLLVYVDLIDASQLKKWQDSYDLADLSAMLGDQPPTTPNYLVSYGEGGSQLQLRWNGKAPGDTLLHTAIPITCALMLSFGLIATFFYRSALQSMVLLDQSRERIEHLAHHDPLTGLANRNYLKQHLEHRLAAEVLVNAPLYLLSLDLDRFKPINDLFGHATGDAVLCELAARLLQHTNDTDIVARIGGDEFVLVVSEAADNIVELCNRLCQSFSAPIQANGHQVAVGVSIGVAVAPADATLPSELLRLSDVALYEAKTAGRNNWKFYAQQVIPESVSL